MPGSLETRLRKLEGGRSVAGVVHTITTHDNQTFAFSAGELAKLMRDIDGRSRGLPK